MNVSAYIQIQLDSILDLRFFCIPYFAVTLTVSECWKGKLCRHLWVLREYALQVGMVGMYAVLYAYAHFKCVITWVFAVEGENDKRQRWHL